MKDNNREPSRMRAEDVALARRWGSRARWAAGLSLCLLAVTAFPARGDYITERWGHGPPCQHPGTVTFAERVLKFDLAALPRGTKWSVSELTPGLARGRFSLR